LELRAIEANLTTLNDKNCIIVEGLEKIIQRYVSNGVLTDLADYVTMKIY